MASNLLLIQSDLVINHFISRAPIEYSTVYSSQENGVPNLKKSKLQAAQVFNQTSV